MAGRSGALALTLLALCLAVTTAQRRAVLSVNGQPQVSIGAAYWGKEQSVRGARPQVACWQAVVSDAHNS